MALDKLLTIERIDEKGRVNGITTVLATGAGVVQTHGFSYVHARNMMEDLDVPMGLNSEKYKSIYISKFKQKYN